MEEYGTVKLWMLERNNMYGKEKKENKIRKEKEIKREKK